MTLKQHGLKMVAILSLAMAILLSGCQFGGAPAATPTAIVPSSAVLQTTPLGGDTTFNEIATQGAQTSQTQTAMAGTPTTPQPVVVTGTLLTPVDVIGTPTNLVPGATTIVATVPQVNTTPNGPVPTSGPKPASYTLQAGEFPYCIARRFNVNPDELLSINGISDGQMYLPGLVLKIPQTGNPFPANRALATHPTTYTVGSSTETVYSIACRYGDVDPATLASYNNITVATKLTAGQVLNIP